jgi:hypothetical protein
MGRSIFVAAAMSAIAAGCGGAPDERAPADESQGALNSNAIGGWGDDGSGSWGSGSWGSGGLGTIHPPSVKRTDKCPVTCYDYTDSYGRPARCCTSETPKLGNIFTGYYYCSSECISVN